MNPPSSTQHNHASKEQEIKDMWLSDIAGWYTKMEQATTYTEKMWFHSLHKRAVDIYEAELMKLRLTSINVTYPMTHWHRNDDQAAIQYSHSIQQTDTQEDEIHQEDTNSSNT